MPDIDEIKINIGRQAVDVYRANHAKIYEHGWHKGIPGEHTPLLHALLAILGGQGFNSIEEFFTASDELGGWR